MTAKEARIAAEKFNSSEDNTSLTAARKAIEAAAKEGLYSTSVFEFLRPATKAVLEREGYKVTLRRGEDQRDRDSFEITW